jgi:hypothetical protein
MAKDTIIDRIMQTANDLMVLPPCDSEELGCLVGGISKLLIDPAQFLTITEAMRYAYTIGYRRGRASSFSFIVGADDLNDVPE